MNNKENKNQENTEKAINETELRGGTSGEGDKTNDNENVEPKSKINKIKKFFLFGGIFILFILIFLFGIKFLLKDGDETKNIGESFYSKMKENYGLDFTEREKKCLEEYEQKSNRIIDLYSDNKKEEARQLLDEVRGSLDSYCGINLDELQYTGRYFRRIIGRLIYPDIARSFIYYDIYNTSGNDEEVLQFCSEMANEAAKYTDKSRALFTEELAELSLVYPEEIVEEKIFKQYPLINYYKGKGSMWENYRELLKTSYTIHELMGVDYKLAYYYLEEAIANKDNPDEFKHNSDLFNTFMGLGDYFYYDHEYILNGKSYGKGIENYWENVDPQYAFAYKIIRARINDRAKGYQINLNHSLSNEEIEKLFKEALDLTKNPFVSSLRWSPEHFARLYYAVFLNNAYGQSRADDIKQLLEPIYQEKGNSKRGIFVFLQKEKVYPNNYPHKQDILRLAQVDPRMKDMLLAAGWEVE